MTRSFQILLASDPASFPESSVRPTAAGRRRSRDVLDVFVGGANVTARAVRTEAAPVLRDLALGLADLLRRGSGKKVVAFYDDPWELCVERHAGMASLSVYRSGKDPDVRVYDAHTPFEDVVQGVQEAVAACLARDLADSMRTELAAAARTLTDAARVPQVANEVDPRSRTMDLDTVAVDGDRDAPLTFGAELLLRSSPSSDNDPADDGAVQRPDLHALLFRGRLRAEVRGRVVDLGEGHPFLFAERLLTLAEATLEAWEHARARHVRAVAGGFVLGVRVNPAGDGALTLGAEHGESSATFPCLSVADIVEATLALGRGMARAVLRRDRAAFLNLRLTSFRRRLRTLSDRLREVSRDDGKINLTPEPYRAFAALHTGVAPSATPPGKLRYAQRWRALVPGIDLRATFLCGDRLVVGAATETSCLDRSSGEVLWRVPTRRAVAVVTPGGVARLGAEGDVAVHDFGNGEVTLTTRIAPRLGGPPVGAVVNTPGLPRLLVVTEGERHLMALDLTSGEPRWRYTWSAQRAPGGLRIKRSGRLLYLAAGDSALTAVDVHTGGVVWRARSRLRFRAAPVVDGDAVLAVAGGSNCPAEVVSLDAFSGQTRYRSMVGAGLPCTVEGSPLVAGHSVVLALRGRHGLRLGAVCRDSGAPQWLHDAAVAPVGTSWLGIDDLIVGNTPNGELLAVEATSGAVRYRHPLGRVLEADVPRRLEPVLRSGALFVPHADVQVFRPSDGHQIGTIGPCEAIPDLLRVDERCDVYVAEESGHLVAFGAGPRLMLVR